MFRKAILFFSIVFGSCPAFAEGDQYLPANKYMRLKFPRDHGVHRKSAYEWWYLTSHLFDDKGKKVGGAQITLFRIGPKPPSFAKRSHLMVHLAVTRLDQKKHFQASFSLPEKEKLTNLSETGLSFKLPGFSLWQGKV